MAKNRPEPEESVDSEEEESGQEEEEEEASSDENGGSDSDPEPTLTTQVTKKPPASAPKKPQPSSQSKPASSSEESSDSDSDSNQNVKPIASKPMDDPKPPSAAATPTKKPRSKPPAAKPTSPTKPTAGTKRPPTADGEAKEPKKSKKKPNVEVEVEESSVKKDSKKKPAVEVEVEVENSAKKSLSEDPKKQLFQRLWSEEDEIAVLKGMIAYAEEKNADPVADLNAFHDFIRESLQLDATRTQLQDKIRRLKKKYENNARKEKKGKERTFSKTHEQNAYDLSKKIWGGHKAQNGSVAKAAESSKASNASARKERIKNAVIPVKGSTLAAEVDHGLDEEKEANTNMDVDIKVEGFKGLNLGVGSLFGKSLNELAEWIEKNKVGLSEEKAIEMEEKWRALRVAELELFLKKTALIQEQGRLVLDALK